LKPDSDLKPDDELVEMIAREFAKLGLDQEEFDDDDDPPEVDEMVLGQLANRQLSQASSQLILRFISSYGSWHKAYCRILIEHFNRSDTSQSNSE